MTQCPFLWLSVTMRAELREGRERAQPPSPLRTPRYTGDQWRDRGSRVSSARGMTDEDSKEDPTVLAPTLDEFQPEKMTKYVIWASVITTTLFEVPGRVRPGGRSDRRSHFYAPSRFRRTCDLGFERFGKNTHGPPKQRGDDRDRPCPALEGVRLGVPGKFAPL